MARKTDVFVATAGRDAGKQFVITEMPATKAEKWAARALFAIGKAGVEMPEDLAVAGMAGFAFVGLRAVVGMAFEDAEPLLDEMMACAAIQPDPTKPITRPIMDIDIEEVATILALRDRVVQLHVGFSIAAELGKLGAAAKGTSSPTPTFPEASAQ